MSLRRLKRKKGWVWHIDVRHPVMGRRVIRSLKTLNEKEALENAANLYPDLFSVSEKSPQLSLQALHDRVVGYKSIDRAQKTVEGYGSAFKSLTAFLGPDAPARSVTVDTIYQWQAQASVKPSSLNQYTATLKEAFGQAVTRGWLERNPFGNIPRLHITETPEAKFFTDDQIDALFTAITDRKLFHFASLCLRAGLRLSEALELTNRNIVGNQVRILKTKTRKARAVPISQKLNEALADFRPIREQRSWAYNSFVALCQRVDLDGHPHMLRHTFSARHLSAGVPILTVSRWLGHASVQTTERTYGHLIPGSQDHLIDLGDR